MNATKQKLLNELGVVPTEQFNPEEAVRLRIDYLKNVLRSTGRKGLVLGISGGVDSTLAGRLSQIAVNELNAEGYDSKFVAVRLPSGVQKDEDDAQMALEFINPTVVQVINIGEAADVMSALCVGSYLPDIDITKESSDFNKGNIKARLRMIAQYHLAAVHEGLVLGTDHYAEKVSGFYTIHGDGACDLTVLDGLNKRQVRICAKYLGAPMELYDKAATADLEDLNEHLLDEVALGVSYDQIDNLLEGKVIDSDAEEIILRRYASTEFKRNPPYSFLS